MQLHSEFVFQITPGSKASTANLCPGDVIVAINGLSTENMTHNDAQERIKAATHQLSLRIERYVNISAYFWEKILYNQPTKTLQPLCRLPTSNNSENFTKPFKLHTCKPTSPTPHQAIVPEHILRNRINFHQGTLLKNHWAMNPIPHCLYWLHKPYIYHREIFLTFLGNKKLERAKQRP